MPSDVLKSGAIARDTQAELKHSRTLARALLDGLTGDLKGDCCMVTATQEPRTEIPVPVIGHLNSWEVHDMHKAYRYLGSFLLAGALLAPVAIRANVGSQERGEERRGQEERREQQEKHRRYYDRDRRDWHEWDEREDRAYRRYLQERRREYREFERQNKKEQREYWKWRHGHPDRD
jgi:hypothetical protein